MYGYRIIPITNSLTFSIMWKSLIKKLVKTIYVSASFYNTEKNLNRKSRHDTFSLKPYCLKNQLIFERKLTELIYFLHIVIFWNSLSIIKIKFFKIYVYHIISHWFTRKLPNESHKSDIIILTEKFISVEFL